MKTLLYLTVITMLFFSCQKAHTSDGFTRPTGAELHEQAGRILTFFKTDHEFTDQVEKSVLRTFEANLPYTLTEVNTTEVMGRLVTDVTYKTAEGESTFMIVTDLITKEKRIIDCTGSCQCRERLIIKPDGTEIYECTCDNCKMEITTMP